MPTMIAADFHQIYNAFFDGFQLSRRYADQTEQLPVPRQSGEGALRRFVPRPDLEIVISDYTLTRNRQFQLRTDSAMVELSFCLQGKRELHISGTRHEFPSRQRKFLWRFLPRIKIPETVEKIRAGVDYSALIL
ncbi:hypothetical protein NLX71_06555 [Paenibacillus sp. MZ04-78.2]|uniref:hypothetical protein n=1 Tax=Paenibacillus sp. MZ04-78.2 TaxID=2962034 RepID=UPI0020B861E0|nr:hypothetical protein [Paenibacillus sp. MZ04-78.2]MCP3772985.1 hypothetical protein [Paenibacillus sp. MZ04-78.2]